MGLFSKFRNAFRGIRLNDKNALNGYLLDHLLVGSMYAEQQSAYLNSYDTGLSRSSVVKLVETYWDVYDKNQAIDILESLHTRNDDAHLDIVYKAYEFKDSYVDILKSNLPAEEEIFDHYLTIFRSINKVVPELIEQKVITSFSELRKIKDSGWNYGRGAFLARCCYDLSYLSENELKDYLEKSYTELKKYCSSWKEYTTSYIFGRAMWGGPSNSGMIYIADSLLKNDNSPLKNKTYL